MIDNFEKYNIPVITDGVRLPKFTILPEYLQKMSLCANTSDYEFLLALCLEGLEKRVGRNNPRHKEYYGRMKSELSVFKELGFCGYLLITWEIIHFCKENSIPTGFGRGSAAGSLVLFLIGVTEIDSLKYGLYFERFLSKTRAKFKEKDGVKYYDGSLLLDIDLDISFSHRNKVISWLNKKYEGKISKLPVVSTYTTKILLKEVVKTYLEYNEEKAIALSEMIPVIFGKVKSIETAYKESPDFKEFADNNKEVIEIAKKLYALPKHFGVHASAWIITAENIDNSFPLQLTKEKDLVTSFTMDDALEIAIKVDILGLRCATLIDNICKKINIKPTDIDLTDKFIYKQFEDFQTPHGCFQIEADCNYKVLRQVKPKNLEHLSAVMALARPGALEFVDSFAEFVNTGNFQSIHPFFDEVLKDTGGVCLYQEQALKMANKIGFSLEEGELIRRCISKKKTDEMQEWKSKLYQKVKENNLDNKIADIFWEILDNSSNYSFNFSHSLSYASMAAATVYLKYKYPKEFYLALLELSKDESDTIGEIQVIQKELTFFGIKLLGPDIIKSDIDFKIEGDDLRFGLGFIRGVATKTIEKLQQFKHSYSSKFEIFMGAEEAGINIGVLSAFAQAGVMDSFLTQGRTRTVLEAQTWSLLTNREKKRVIDMGKDYNYDLLKIIADLSKTQDEKGKTFIKESRMATIRKSYDKYKQIYIQNIRNEELANYFYEKALMGFSYSQDLAEILRKEYPNAISIKDVKNEIDNANVTFGGEILEISYNKSKKDGKKYLKALIEDSASIMWVMIFGDERIEMNNEINGCILQVGDLVMCQGSKKTDIVFCNKMIKQKINIFIKLADLKAFRQNETNDKILVDNSAQIL